MNAENFRRMVPSAGLSGGPHREQLLGEPGAEVG